MKKAIKKWKQRGFTLVEVMIVIAIAAGVLGVTMVLKKRSDVGGSSNDMVTATANLTSKIHSFYGSQGYNALSPTAVNNMQLVTTPLSWAGANVHDAWGNTMQFVGNAVGANPSYVITIGGATSPLDKDACTNLATALAPGADAVVVGAGVTTTNGIAGGTDVYKSVATGTTDMATLTGAGGATGCAATNPVIALQYH